MRTLLLSISLLLTGLPSFAASPEPASKAPATSTARNAVKVGVRSDTVPAQPPVLGSCPAGEGTLLERAVLLYDRQEFEAARSCAAQAASSHPNEPLAHAEHAAALVAAGELEEARVAFAQALALDPDHLDSLLGAADLYLQRLAITRAHTELGLAYAARGRLVARQAGDRQLAGRFALLEATALNSLGRNMDALARAELAVAAEVDLPLARYERAVALWELCRFHEARREFERLTKAPERAALAHYHLGLIAERLGKDAVATREFATARSLAPEAFPPATKATPEEFAMLLVEALEGLPEVERRALEGVTVSAVDLPALEDLVSSSPPLSPEIVGLFRGPPIGEPCPEGAKGGCRAIIVYRRNLLRTVGDREELRRQVRVTLEHELGHLHGEDDAQLVARGLE